MFEWLFERKDTAESLTKEVNSFFDGFRRLQTRIENLVLVNKEAKDEEDKLNGDTCEELNTTLSNALVRANKTFNEDIDEERVRHEGVVEKLDAETKTLIGSLRLAIKVVNFAEED